MIFWQKVAFWNGLCFYIFASQGWLLTFCLFSFQKPVVQEPKRPETPIEEPEEEELEAEVEPEPEVVEPEVIEPDVVEEVN